MSLQQISWLCAALLISCLNNASAEIVHPGVAHSTDDIQFVRDKIAANQQPWIGAWKQLKKSHYASLKYRPEPYQAVERGPYNNPDIGSSEFSRDAWAAYTHALIWVIGDQEEHAKKSAEILDAWSDKLEEIIGHDARLITGISGYRYCTAAELLKHTWDGWPDQQQARFRQMMLEVWYPLVKDFYPSANGNWDASMMQLVMAMGVHLDDQSLIDGCAEYYRNGVGNGAVRNYFNEFGQCQESGRDQGHTQMGLEFLSNTCQTAWIQGIDLYGAHDNRLLKGFEYTAKYNLGGDVPFKRFPSYQGRYNYRKISDDARGRFRPTYEKVLRHYQHRLGTAAPYSERAAANVRKKAKRRVRSATLIDMLMFAAEPIGPKTSAQNKGVEIEKDVVIFGATSSGIIAAVELAASGKTVEIVEPSEHIGGLTSGGLGATDIGNKQVIGGLSRDFYRRVAEHYKKDKSWVHETREDFFAHRSKRSKLSEIQGEAGTMWSFEPHVASQVFRKMLREAKLFPRTNQKLIDVTKSGSKITSIRTSDLVLKAKAFIDATYEGDLMAKAGVSYRVGREANSEYKETLNGIRDKTPKNQIYGGVDPYVISGDPASGLIPLIQPGDGGKPGAGDQRVQAYNFRLCFTDVPENRMELTPPENYDPGLYELAARRAEKIVASGAEPKLKQFCNPVWMPNRKTDINNSQGISTDYIGENYEYPDGDTATRAKIWQRHEDYIRGFWYFMSTSSRVPENLRKQFLEFGPCRDEFLVTGGWPAQLYVREARRMVSDYVMTEHNCRGVTTVKNPIGMAAYGMDSHNCQRVVKNGAARNEGDVQVHGFPPYPIAFESIVPAAGQCDNLVVPVCVSATHIAFGSIRMEPVFMVLGQSAGAVANLAIDGGTTVQAIDQAALRKTLLERGQVLESGGKKKVSHWSSETKNDWNDAGNWSGGKLPAAKAAVVINRNTPVPTIQQDLGVNLGSLSVGHGLSQTGALTMTAGKLEATSIASRKTRVGYGGGAGQVLLSGGEMKLTCLQIGLDAQSAGSFAISGGRLALSRSISDDIGSLSLGEGNAEGAATMSVSAGQIDCVSGVTLARNDGHAIFELHSGGGPEIKIGTGDGGFWRQHAGGTLRLIAGDGAVGADAAGLQILGGGKHAGDVFFAKNSRLHPVFKADPTAGSWDVMHWDGDLDDQGLKLANEVDSNVWSFQFVDTDESGGPDTLRITAAGK